MALLWFERGWGVDIYVGARVHGCLVKPVGGCATWKEQLNHEHGEWRLCQHGWWTAPNIFAVHVGSCWSAFADQSCHQVHRCLLNAPLSGSKMLIPLDASTNLLHFYLDILISFLTGYDIISEVNIIMMYILKYHIIKL